MDFGLAKEFDARKKTDVLIIPFWEGKKSAEIAASIGSFSKELQAPVQSGDFKGKKGQTALVYPEKSKEKRVMLLGLGKKEDWSTEVIRQAYHAGAKLGQKIEATTATVVVPDLYKQEAEQVIRGISEGILLTNYTFEKHQLEKQKNSPTVLLKRIDLVGVGKHGLALAKKGALIAEGVYLARDLVNSNADDITPQFLSSLAKQLAKQYPKVKSTVFDKKRIQKEGMELLLAVNRGSANDPAFIIMEYKGNPRSKEVTAVVGKGVTYDTGGLNLKPTGHMETMKCDMSGAAACFGALKAAAEVGLKKNLTFIVPSTENSIGGASYKPGDVYSSYLGKTVEITNTDAEGRLILADALGYAQKNIKPNRIIDLATLTGAIVIALGEEVTGLMSNNHDLANELFEAGQTTYERVWRMPLYEEFKEHLKSDFADIQNAGGREGGSITAALFLQEFVGDIPWAHLDIAGTAFLSKGKGYKPKHGTGEGVRLLMELFEQS